MKKLIKAHEEWVCLVALGRKFHSHAPLAANDLQPHSAWFVRMWSFSAPRVLPYLRYHYIGVVCVKEQYNANVGKHQCIEDDYKVNCKLHAKEFGW